MKHEIYLAVKDIKLIQETIDKMPEGAVVDSVKLTYESTGIGYNLWVTKTINLTGLQGDFCVEVSDPASWE